MANVTSAVDFFDTLEQDFVAIAAECPSLSRKLDLAMPIPLSVSLGNYFKISRISADNLAVKL